MNAITGTEAKSRIIRNVELLRRDYDELWQRYVDIVHENARLCEKLDRLRREGSLT